MIQKILLRLFLVCLALVLLVVGGAIVVYNLATAVPTAYAGAIQIENADRAKQRLERTLVRLAGVGLSSQHRARLRFESTQAKQPDPREWSALMDELDRGAMRTTQTIGQNELNAWIVEEIPVDRGDGLHDPRIILQDGRMMLACRLSGNGLSVVLTAELTPRVTPSQLILEIRSFRIGHIPLPINRLAQLFAELGTNSGNRLTLDVTSSPPRLCLDWDDDDDVRIRVVDVTLKGQQIEITVEAANSAEDESIRAAQRHRV